MWGCENYKVITYLNGSDFKWSFTVSVVFDLSWPQTLSCNKFEAALGTVQLQPGRVLAPSHNCRQNGFTTTHWGQAAAKTAGFSWQIGAEEGQSALSANTAMMRGRNTIKGQYYVDLSDSRIIFLSSIFTASDNSLFTNMKKWLGEKGLGSKNHIISNKRLLWGVTLDEVHRVKGDYNEKYNVTLFRNLSFCFVNPPLLV